jgi:hypothetical protein
MVSLERSSSGVRRKLQRIGLVWPLARESLARNLTGAVSAFRSMSSRIFTTCEVLHAPMPRRQHLAFEDAALFRPKGFCESWCAECGRVRSTLARRNRLRPKARPLCWARDDVRIRPRDSEFLELDARGAGCSPRMSDSGPRRH